MISRQKFAMLLKSLSVMVPKFSPVFDEFAIAVWHDAFKDCDEQKLTETILKLRFSENEFPSVKKIRETYDELTGSIPKAPFDEIIRLASNSRNIPENTHPAILIAVKKLGGWETVANWNPDEYHFKRKNLDEIWPEVQVQIRSTPLLDEKKGAKLLKDLGMI